MTKKSCKHKYTALNYNEIWDQIVENYFKPKIMNKNYLLKQSWIRMDAYILPTAISLPTPSPPSGSNKSKQSNSK